MPHVIVKMITGKSEAQKQQMAEKITQSIMNVLDCGEDIISVSMEEVPREDWAEKVYRPDITDKPDQLYKKPGYSV
jgi:4-oxalocrotonate tautomerase